MELTSCSPGLAANAAQLTIQLVEDYTDLSQQYLKQQLNQAQTGAEGVKGACAFTRASIQSMSSGTDEEGRGLLANGALQIGGQSVGYIRGLKTNGQIAENQEKLSNVNHAIGHLQATVPQDPAVARSGNAQNLGNNHFEEKYIKQQGFKYGDAIEAYDPKTNNLIKEAPTSALEKQKAIDEANKASSNFQNQIDKLLNEQQNHQHWYSSLGQGAGAIAQGAAAQQKSAQQSQQAEFDSANVAVKYLQDSSASNNNTATSAFENAKSHVGQVLQNAGSLAEVDNMRA